MDRPMSFHAMEALMRREFQTLRCNEIKARTKEKQWTVALSDIPWPRIEAVAEFRLRTRETVDRGNGEDPPDVKPTGGNGEDPSDSLQEKMEKTHLIRCSKEEMEKTHLIRCLAINPHALYVTYRRKSGEAPSQIRRENGEDPPDSVFKGGNGEDPPDSVSSDQPTCPLCNLQEEIWRSTFTD
ncbi:unnamed protein product [Rodentolepis nana]|uniref:Uncharacterized protein n=1 Tax=Rodentolepis nana TaxID=102285 RepID=A0A0R3TGW8_RODNA|nr:unnamed protein product [Rodentolepis nana]